MRTGAHLVIFSIVGAVVVAGEAAPAAHVAWRSVETQPVKLFTPSTTTGTTQGVVKGAVEQVKGFLGLETAGGAETKNQTEDEEGCGSHSSCLACVIKPKCKWCSLKDSSSSTTTGAAGSTSSGSSTGSSTASSTTTSVSSTTGSSTSALRRMLNAGSVCKNSDATDVDAYDCTLICVAGAGALKWMGVMAAGVLWLQSI